MPQAIIGINPWVAGRNADVFGEDPEAFKPTRWLVGKEVSQKMDNYLLGFGQDSRTCMGKHIALLEMNKLVPQIVRNYDLSLADQNMVLETKNVWFVKQTDIKIHVKERVFPL